MPGPFALLIQLYALKGNSTAIFMEEISEEGNLGRFLGVVQWDLNSKNNLMDFGSFRRLQSPSKILFGQTNEFQPQPV